MKGAINEHEGSHQITLSRLRWEKLRRYGLRIIQQRKKGLLWGSECGDTPVLPWMYEWKPYQ
ncbi:hypothetical protein AGMMS49940_24030 [Spirochaetia bacterium]|nr:hypothetical protein AGMMS49940_24030 [Spirochaetia bacterium]